MNSALRPVRTEIRDSVDNLPLLEEGPRIDYSQALSAYVLSTCLLFDRRGTPTPSTFFSPTRETELLLVQRGSTGRWGGVSGHIDTLTDPRGRIDDDDFDPFTYVAYREFIEKCGLPPEETNYIALYHGQRFVTRSTLVQRSGSQARHILPFAGMWHWRSKPRITVDGHEALAHQWVPLGQVRQVADVATGFLDQTLPRALAGLYLSQKQIHNLTELP